MASIYQSSLVVEFVSCNISRIELRIVVQNHGSIRQVRLVGDVALAAKSMPVRISDEATTRVAPSLIRIDIDFTPTALGV